MLFKKNVLKIVFVAVVIVVKIYLKIAVAKPFVIIAVYVIVKENAVPVEECAKVFVLGFVKGFVKVVLALYAIFIEINE